MEIYSLCRRYLLAQRVSSGWMDGLTALMYVPGAADTAVPLAEGGASSPLEEMEDNGESVERGDK